MSLKTFLARLAVAMIFAFVLAFYFSWILELYIAGTIGAWLIIMLMGFVGFLAGDLFRTIIDAIK